MLRETTLVGQKRFLSVATTSNDPNYKSSLEKIEINHSVVLRSVNNNDKTKCDKLELSNKT